MRAAFPWQVFAVDSQVGAIQGGSAMLIQSSPQRQPVRPLLVPRCAKAETNTPKPMVIAAPKGQAGQQGSYAYPEQQAESPQHDHQLD